MQLFVFYTEQLYQKDMHKPEVGAGFQWPIGFISDFLT